MLEGLHRTICDDHKNKLKVASEFDLIYGSWQKPSNTDVVPNDQYMLMNQEEGKLGKQKVRAEKFKAEGVSINLALELVELCGVLGQKTI